MSAPHNNAGHPPHLAHHFDTPAQQFQSAVLGMWLFLATEILLFGGLFCAYAVYRANHPDIFAHAHRYLDTTLGAINTVILLCSSFTMASAVWAAQHGKRRMLVGLLALTLLCAAGFLGIKYVEYQHKWKHGLLWGRYYAPRHDTPGDDVHAAGRQPADGAADRPTPAPATAPSVAENTAFTPSSLGPAGLRPPGRQPSRYEPEKKVRNVQTFFGVYFGMTGLHALHVIAGMIAIAWILVLAAKGRYSADYFTPVPMVGLYWHVVDLIWIYLFPLFYLIH